MTKVGRNDPCPCGSGKKYKQCHGKPLMAPPARPDGHTGAADAALAWLLGRHRKGGAAAIERMLFGGLTEQAKGVLASLGQKLWAGIHQNSMEWLLAEGEVEVKGVPTRVQQLLLSAGGPAFSTGQREWVRQLGERPLRLYEVIAVAPGKEMTLRDALDETLAPVAVQEHAGSQESLMGSLLGARLLLVDGGWEFSGALYSFSPEWGGALAARLREQPAVSAAQVSQALRSHWLARFYDPAAMPAPFDEDTREAISFITDRYEVRDWAELEAAVLAQPDVDGNREEGWHRMYRGGDGQDRPKVSITPSTEAAIVEVFYRTQPWALEGRAWFEALAGDAARFLDRRVEDPREMVLAGAPAGRSSV